MKFLYVSIIQFILETVINYNIDESHAIRHSLDTMKNAYNLYTFEKIENPWLSEYEEIIMTSSLIHDLCDSKYIEKEETLAMIKYNLNSHFNQTQIDDIIKIITTMSYSYVKKNGFPKNFGRLILPYHITREADLIQGYDISRSITYSLLKKHNMQKNITTSIEETIDFFNKRVLQHDKDGLFVTQTSKSFSKLLDLLINLDLQQWEKINEI